MSKVSIDSEHADDAARRGGNPTRPEEPGSPRSVARNEPDAKAQAGRLPDEGRRATGGAGPNAAVDHGSARRTETVPAAVRQPGRTAEPSSGGLGGQQEDVRGALSGQGLYKDTVNPTHQRDDNQDDLGRDINDPSSMSTNNTGCRRSGPGGAR